MKKKHKEFTVIKVNLNTIKKDDEEHLYNKDDFYLEFNNVGHHNIIWINYIYDYYILYLKPKTTNNFFLKAIFKPIKKVYIEEKTRYWIFTIRTTIYKTFILLSKYLSIYIKEEVTLKRY